ncbi:aspartate-alanine antiporter [Delftia tsuruhatensis]|nr:aspartate-alanine antiporter [Delftia acidovorans CCUG 274B]MPT04292.1 aspartate-alanine antiporter [Delftia sp.]PZP74338.1 MAG: aspartate-alanine antiporter [Delftia acidovorans]TDF23714.1 aspartate-alanine antiporter [Delftia tsuruhatensis]
MPPALLGQPLPLPCTAVDLNLEAEVAVDFLRSIFHQAPEIALFAALALGYWVGKFRFGSFQLGGVAGSLLAAVLISQVGVTIDSGIKAVLFALFIYAVGFESGPQFFRSLGRQSVKEILMALVVAVSGLVTVVVIARVFHLDKGLAAGLAAGGLTQSAIIGTAGSAIEKLGLAPDEVQRMQANVAIGYAVTYIFGSFGAIIMCVNVLQWLTGRKIREDAIQAEQELLKGVRVYGTGESPAVPDLVGRIFRVGQAGRTVAELEASATASGGTVTVERIQRRNAMVGVDGSLALEAGDIILLVGRRAAVVALGASVGEELQGAEGMDVVMVRRDVAISNRQYLNRSVKDILDSLSQEFKHGVYAVALMRAGTPVPIAPATMVMPGDVVTLFGTPQDVQKAAQSVGPIIVPSDKTDFVFHGLGITVGLLIGLLVLRLGSIPITLGSGGGALLAGLLFGWWRSRKHTFGNMPTAASTLLRDLGLAGFVAMVGLQSGQQAVTTVMQQGLTLFLLGVVVTIVPLLIAMLFGKYVLRYDNVAVFAGSLSGARSANPAFGEILDKAGNSIPTAPFAITYALANVFLTLLGPLVIAFA